MPGFIFYLFKSHVGKKKLQDDKGQKSNSQCMVLFLTLGFNYILDMMVCE